MNYEPRNLKVKFETKNAFITMGTQREAEEFINKIQELFNNNKSQDIYFSLYKSKVERISSHANFRRFNDMPSMQMKNNSMNMNSMYKSYNGKHLYLIFFNNYKILLLYFLSFLRYE